MTILGLSIEVYIINLVIAIPVFFLLRWLSKKVFRSNAQTRKTLPWIGNIVVAPFIYVSILLIWFWSASYHPSMAFNEAKWKNSPSERYEITNDLISSWQLIGLTKGEVTKLLGNYEYTYGENHWAYYIGHEPGLFNIDPSVLDVYFENERVIKVAQHET